jgi:putative tricarboxylic transport membrane protein
MLTSFVGAYSVTNSMFSVWVVLVFGIIGYFMKRLALPMAPLVLGLVLGPLFEKALVQTSAMGDGSLTIIFDRPIVMVVLGLALVQVAAPAIFSRLLRGRRAAAATSAK